MEPELQETDLLRRLEEQLLQPETRSSADQLGKLLADEFIEFGSSGRVFDKAKIIESLQQEQHLPHARSVQRSIADFSARRLAPEIVLVTYRIVVRAASHEERHTLRSSIWKSIDGRWQMVFHQGTLSKPG